MHYYLRCIQQLYFVFDGRASRSEYWHFLFINLGIGLCMAFVDFVLGTHLVNNVGLFGGMYALLIAIPGLAVSVRRLHDTDKSGWWLLLYFIPVLGFLALLVFFVTRGNTKANEYGPVPD